MMRIISSIEKSSDKEYYSWQNTTPSFDYYIPEPEYYNSDTRLKQYKTYQNPNVYLPPPPDPDDIRRWFGRGRSRARRLELNSHRHFGEKTRSLESHIACKCKKNQRQHERKLYDS